MQNDWRFPLVAVLLACGQIARADGPRPQPPERFDLDRPRVSPVAKLLAAGYTEADWRGITAAYEAGRHRAFPQPDGGLAARNPRQGYRSRFDGRGVWLEPQSAAWQWGLDLKSYGFPGDEREIEGEASVSHDGNRVEYEWDGVLQEWFTNHLEGLEQGWTLRERPPQSGGGDSPQPLTLRLGIRGELAPQIDPCGTAVEFQDPQTGQTALTYENLRAEDANGTPLTARFAPAPQGQIAIEVDESQAAYPITIDPIVKQAYLKAADPSPIPGKQYGDMFGHAVDIDGDSIVIGASSDDSYALGVNGDQSNNDWGHSGAAYVFVRDDEGNWSQQAYLKGSHHLISGFGGAVSISGNTVVVGAVGDRGAGRGVNAPVSDWDFETARNSGAVFVFNRDPETQAWAFDSYIKASNADRHDRFGDSVAIDGNCFVVGASFEQSRFPSNFEDPWDNGIQNGSGAAYVFERDFVGGPWREVDYLKPHANPAYIQHFGEAVAIDGEIVAVGAEYEDLEGTGIDPDPYASRIGDSCGAVYVFERDPSTGEWPRTAYIKPPNASYYLFFGCSVSVSQNRLAVGAFGLGSWYGGAYIYEKDEETGSWAWQDTVTASDRGDGEHFGFSVALDGDALAVGARWADEGATISNPPENMGAAYFFAYDPVVNLWYEQRKVTATYRDEDDEFGYAVGLSGETAVVGNYGDASASSGVNGDESDNTKWRIGSAFVYTGIGVDAERGIKITGTKRTGRIIAVWFEGPPGRDDWVVVGGKTPATMTDTYRSPQLIEYDGNSGRYWLQITIPDPNPGPRYFLKVGRVPDSP